MQYSGIVLCLKPAALFINGTYQIKVSLICHNEIVDEICILIALVKQPPTEVTPFPSIIIIQQLHCLYFVRQRVQI
jgi:hypothetical protein